MAPLKALVILAGLGVAGAGAQAAPASFAPNLPAGQGVVSVEGIDFSVLLGIPGLDHRDRHADRRQISPRRAIRIATDRVPMRVTSVDKHRRTYVVNGVNRRGTVEVEVHRFSGRVLDVDFERDRRGRHGRGHHRISADRAADIATAHIPMRVRSVTPHRGIYEVRGFNRRRGEVTIDVNSRSGRIEDVDYERGRHARRGDHDHDRDHDRDGRRLERRGGGLDIIIQNNDDDDDRERRRENLRNVGP